MLEYLPVLQGLGAALFGNQALKKTAKRNYGDYAAQQGLAEAQGLSAALANPNDPRYKQIEAQETDAALQDYQMGLQDLITQNRRLSAMGRTPLFDTERGGEQLYRAMLLGRRQVGKQARDATNERLKAGITANQGVSRYGMAASELERERRGLSEVGKYRFNTGLSNAFLGGF